MSRHDQRTAARTKLNARLYVVDIESGVELEVEAIDSSPGGLAFHSALEPALGAEMDVTVPGRPRSAFTVLRIAPTENGYDIAGQLRARWSV
jgi:hypothetical protein